MSRLEKEPTVVAFDGLHRAGKGTQALLLHNTIYVNGGSSVILRGDGTRDGLGLHEGDPYSEEWQSRNHTVKSAPGNTIENWNASSLKLAQELVEKKRERPTKHDALIVDRSVLSRVAFLLHRGEAIEGIRLTLGDMYPRELGIVANVNDIKESIPDIIFELSVLTPDPLMQRLDSEDPKYTFRARNIRGGFHAATQAKHHLPQFIENRVVTIDATQEVEVIHNCVKKYLSATALARFFN